VDVRFFVGQLGPLVIHPEAIEATLNRADIVRLTDFTEHYFNLTAKAKGIFQ
jgi:cupin superfamily acireductone dioxygenase involved in methionine salvage